MNPKKKKKLSEKKSQKVGCSFAVSNIFDLKNKKIQEGCSFAVSSIRALIEATGQSGQR